MGDLRRHVRAVFERVELDLLERHTVRRYRNHHSLSNLKRLDGPVAIRVLALLARYFGAVLNCTTSTWATTDGVKMPSHMAPPPSDPSPTSKPAPP